MRSTKVLFVRSVFLKHLLAVGDWGLFEDDSQEYFNAPLLTEQWMSGDDRPFPRAAPVGETSDAAEPADAKPGQGYPQSNGIYPQPHLLEKNWKQLIDDITQRGPLDLNEEKQKLRKLLNGSLLCEWLGQLKVEHAMKRNVAAAKAKKADPDSEEVQRDFVEASNHFAAVRKEQQETWTPLSEVFASGQLDFFEELKERLANKLMLIEEDDFEYHPVDRDTRSRLRFLRELLATIGNKVDHANAVFDHDAGHGARTVLVDEISAPLDKRVEELNQKGEDWLDAERAVLFRHCRAWDQRRDF